MASSMIHIAVAKIINEELKYDENLLFLGTIAPDISSILKRKKSRSHFYDRNSTTPDLEKFLMKYKKYLKRPFEMGYFIHLYVDKLWEEVFVKDLIDMESVTLLNGVRIKVKEKDAKKLINNDFSNINMDIMSKYEIDLSLFDKSIRVPKIYINEIPDKKIKMVIDDLNDILNDSKKAKTVLLDTKNVYSFISKTSKEIINELKEMEII